MPARQDRRSRAHFNNTLVALDSLDAATKVVSLPSLPIIVTALSKIVDQVDRTRASDERRDALLSNINELCRAIVDLVNQARSAGDEETMTTLQSRLDYLSMVLAELCERATHLKGGYGFRGALRNFIHAPLNNAILAEMKEGLTRILMIVVLREPVATNMAIERGGAETATKVVDKQSDIYSIPHFAHAGYRSVDGQKSEFMSDTREELFEELRIWSSTGLHEHDPKALYYLSGGAGLGKSAVAHQLCIRLDQQWKLNLGASFFFVRGGGDGESARIFFPTLAYQLATTQPLLRERIAQAGSEYLKANADGRMRCSFERLLLKPLTDSPELLNDQPPTFLVVDGLDECKDRDLVPELLRCLIGLVRLVPWLRVFLTSRPEPHILPILVSAEATDIVHHRSLNDTLTNWSDDVALFLRVTVPKIGRCGAYVQAHPDALTCLISRTQGIFIYARLAVNFLQIYDDDPEESFAVLLASNGAGLSPLDYMYMQILRSGFPPRDVAIGTPRHARVTMLLQFLALRLTDLSPSAIAALFDLREDLVLWLLDRLRSICLIDSTGNVVLLHATFSEFLVDKNRCTDDLYCVDVAKGHAHLASRCLATLSFDVSTHFMRAMRQAATVPADCVRYARHWDVHLKRAERNEALERLLYDSVRLRLPIIVRMYGPPSHSETENIAQFLKRSDNTNELTNEYKTFGDSLADWWKRMHGYKGNSSDVPKLKNRSLGAAAQVQERYQEALDELVEKIRQDGTEDLWYDLTLSCYQWDVRSS